MSTVTVSPLRQRMIEDMNARKLCAGTQRGHIHSCKRFAAFLKRSPDTATAEDIRRFQLHLSETGASICNRNRIMSGLRFLFRVTLRRLDRPPTLRDARAKWSCAMRAFLQECACWISVAVWATSPLNYSPAQLVGSAGQVTSIDLDQASIETAQRRAAAFSASFGVPPNRDSISATDLAKAEATLETTIIHADSSTSPGASFAFGGSRPAWPSKRPPGTEFLDAETGS